MLRSRLTRARWIIRLSILLVVLLLGIGLWVGLRPGKMSATRALELFLRVQLDMPLAEVEEMLGPHHSEEYANGQKLNWSFCRESLNEIHWVMPSVKVYEGKVVHRGMTTQVMTGASAWQYRWMRLKHMLGF